MVSHVVFEAFSFSSRVHNSVGSSSSSTRLSSTISSVVFSGSPGAVSAGTVMVKSILDGMSEKRLPTATAVVVMPLTWPFTWPLVRIVVVDMMLGEEVRKRC